MKCVRSGNNMRPRQASVRSTLKPPVPASTNDHLFLGSHRPVPNDRCWGALQPIGPLGGARFLAPGLRALKLAIMLLPGQKSRFRQRVEADRLFFPYPVGGR